MDNELSIIQQQESVGRLVFGGKDTGDVMDISNITKKQSQQTINRMMDDALGKAIDPNHYKTEKGYETWDVIKAFELNYFLGNVFKYISRAGKKSKDTYLQDLLKAKAYLDKEIEHITEGEQYGK